MVRTHDSQGRSRRGRDLVEVKYGVDSVRAVRLALMSLAYALAREPATRAYLLLIDPAVTERRLREEWQSSQAVMRREVRRNVTICLRTADGFRGIPHDPPHDLWPEFERLVKETARFARPKKIDYGFVVQKLLFHEWLVRRSPVTADWLSRTAGCSYLTVSRVVKRMGSLIERTSDRRIALRYFPRDEFGRLIAQAEKARSTARFTDHSGQPRPPESHVKRLERLRPKNVAIGGVFGAKHYYPSLDIVGSPRLDLSIHCYEGPLDLEFVRALDPALRREDDPLKPASLAVHAVRHRESLFDPRSPSLAWADPVECLIDLHEARLEHQASEFRAALERTAVVRHAT
jgi:hypothetical protein